MNVSTAHAGVCLLHKALLTHAEPESSFAASTEWDVPGTSPSSSASASACRVTKNAVRAVATDNAPLSAFVRHAKSAK